MAGPGGEQILSNQRLFALAVFTRDRIEAVRRAPTAGYTRQIGVSRGLYASIVRPRQQSTVR